LSALCKSEEFEVSQKIACELNALVAKGEALHEGIFRTGSVSIAGTKMKPPKAEELSSIFENLLEAQFLIENPIERGIATFLSCAKNQFFWDGNKRTGRLLMNGILLSAGQDIITVSASCREEFHTTMIDFYDSNDASSMFSFMAAHSITHRF
jgi:Fic family protein